MAALQAKSRGEVNQAKEYLRLSKGFDKLIGATQSGLPVDLKTVSIHLYYSIFKIARSPCFVVSYSCSLFVCCSLASCSS